MHIQKRNFLFFFILFIILINIFEAFTYLSTPLYYNFHFTFTFKHKIIMTTAHRPTWKAAYGLSDNVNKGYVPTRSYSARDMPGYLKLKERQWGQGSVDQLKQKDFKAQLLKRQAEYKSKKTGEVEIINAKKQLQDDNDADFVQDYEPAPRKKIKRPQNQQGQQILDLGPNPFPQDQDSQSFIKQDQQKPKRRRVDSQQESDEEDDSQLLRQYQKIKQQRQKQQLFKRQQKHKDSMMNRQRQLLKGNPLIDSSYSLSKKWYEDTVFRNQAKKVEQKKTFVNDYVRSDFHRKFMNRYVMR